MAPLNGGEPGRGLTWQLRLFRLDARFGRQDAGFYGAEEGAVVPVVLVGVGDGEIADGPVERRPSAQVGGDGDAVARAGVGPGQGPAADAAVDGQGGRGQVGRVDRDLAVPELAE